ncbi:Adenylylsulphate kinase [uncultured Caudovirales phage]|uniref:Adenylylsulphate kinase n=1 Tax=uncultured Caudovirales phage TaxID=2100421 RepID=A0A6J7WJH3_9CAUD|nr:Adenylylsulphate kinase [uncultured Caudovirales phage]
MIIQIIGLPGSGKTFLAESLSQRINAIHLNADAVRADLNKDLGFGPEARIEQARRMGALARLINSQGWNVVVDFICPTDETRKAFGKADYLVVMDRIPVRDFADTTKMWQDPKEFNVKFNDDLELEDKILYVIKDAGLHDWSAPTTLMLGRYQPWHEGHHALYEEAGKRTDQVMLGVRNTYNTSPKDPLKFDEVKSYIAQDSFMNGAMVVKMPNITNIVYGRDVGYKIEQVSLGADIEAISATQKRKELGI